MPAIIRAHPVLRPILAAALAALGFASLAVAVTYPLVLPEHFSVRLTGGGDSAQNYWNFWWLTQAFKSGNFFPYYTHAIYWPEGVTLSQHPLNLFNGWLVFGLQAVGLNLVQAYNVVTLLSFTLSALSAFGLCYYLTGRAFPSFVGGAIYAFSAFAVHRAAVGNLGLHSIQFIPLTVLLLLLFLRSKRWTHGIGAVLCLGVSFYMNLYVLLALGLLLIALVIAEMLRQRALSVVGLAAVVAVGSTVIGLPFILNYIDGAVVFRGQANQLRAADANNADLLAFFIPDPSVSFVYRSIPEVTQWIWEARSRFFGNPHEKTVFVGYATLFLLIATAPIWIKLGRRWWLAGLGFFILALGPRLYVLGQPLVSGMPYEWLGRIPLVGFGRTPSRMAMALMLCVGVLVAIGLANVKRRATYVILCAVSLLVFVETLPMPMRLDDRPAKIPGFYAAHFGRPEARGAILDVPVDLWAAEGPGGEYMLYQTVHEQPIVGGYIARTPRTALWPFDELPFIHALRARIRGDQEPYQFSPEVLAQARDNLTRLRVRYIIVHAAFLPELEHQNITAALQQVFGSAVYQDEHLQIWDLEYQQVATRIIEHRR